VLKYSNILKGYIPPYCLDCF